MLFLFVEFFVLMLLIFSFSPDWRKVVQVVLFIVFFWSMFWLVLLQLELAHYSPDGTYGSDARYYYEKMVETSKNQKFWPEPGTLTPGYVAFGTLILRFSPNLSVIWVKFGNIGLFLITLVLTFHLLRSWNVSKQISLYITLLIGTNGIILWMVIRNLKDTMFLMLTILIIAYTKYVFTEKRNKFTIFRFLLFFGVFLTIFQLLKSIRPWGAYWGVMTLTASIMETLFFGKNTDLKMHRKVTVLFLLIGLVFVLGFNFTPEKVFFDYDILIDYAENHGGIVQFSFSNLLLAFTRFLIGPGPIRGIFGWEVFLHTTTVGNILITLGAVVWWFYLPIVILAVFSKSRYW
ncbi:MAG: hypothetical protein ACK4MM_06685, partial [Fervidobacterium sp.]